MAWFSEQHGTFNRAKPFIHGNLKYGAAAFKNPTVLAAATIFPLQVIPIDHKYYLMGAESREFERGVWVVSYEQIAKEVDVLKAELTGDTMTWFDSTLGQSDRFVTRQPEMEQYLTNRALNPALGLWRADVYIALEERLIQIANADTFGQLKALGDMPEMDIQPEILVDD